LNRYSCIIGVVGSELCCVVFVLRCSCDGGLYKKMALLTDLKGLRNRAGTVLVIRFSSLKFSRDHPVKRIRSGALNDEG
jgi:hypothetical protein